MLLEENLEGQENLDNPESGHGNEAEVKTQPKNNFGSLIDAISEAKPAGESDEKEAKEIQDEFTPEKYPHAFKDGKKKDWNLIAQELQKQNEYIRKTRNVDKEKQSKITELETQLADLNEKVSKTSSTNNDTRAELIKKLGLPEDNEEWSKSQMLTYNEAYQEILLDKREKERSFKTELETRKASETQNALKMLNDLQEGIPDFKTEAPLSEIAVDPTHAEYDKFEAIQAIDEEYQRLRNGGLSLTDVYKLINFDTIVENAASESQKKVIKNINKAGMKPVAAGPSRKGKPFNIDKVEERVGNIDEGDFGSFIAEISKVESN